MRQVNDVEQEWDSTRAAFGRSHRKDQNFTDDQRAELRRQMDVAHAAVIRARAEARAQEILSRVSK